MSDPELISEDKIRTFEGGATRDAASDKLDFEGFLSPLALEVYAKYMHKHRKQSDGKMRDSDNWQSGFGLSVVLKSAWRHLYDWWRLHRGYRVFDLRSGAPVGVKDAVCGVIFNAFCYLHEMEKKELEEKSKMPNPSPNAAAFVVANGDMAFWGDRCDGCRVPLNQENRSEDRHRLCKRCRTRQLAPSEHGDCSPHITRAAGEAS